MLYVQHRLEPHAGHAMSDEEDSKAKTAIQMVSGLRDCEVTFQSCCDLQPTSSAYQPALKMGRQPLPWHASMATSCMAGYSAAELRKAESEALPEPYCIQVMPVCVSYRGCRYRRGICMPQERPCHCSEESLSHTLFIVITCMMAVYTLGSASLLKACAPSQGKFSVLHRCSVY